MQVAVLRRRMMMFIHAIVIRRSTTMSTELNRSIIRRWLEEGWNGRNLDLIDQLYSPGVIQHDPNSPLAVRSSGEMQMYIGGFQSVFPDLRFTTEDLRCDRRSDLFTIGRLAIGD